MTKKSDLSHYVSYCTVLYLFYDLIPLILDLYLTSFLSFVTSNGTENLVKVVHFPFI